MFHPRSIVILGAWLGAFLCLLGQTACASKSAEPSRPRGATARTTGRGPVQSPRDYSDAPPSTFSLLPKSLQANPVLDMTVFTEMTADGRKLQPPSSDNPVYYVAQADGFHQLGAQVAGEKPPPAAHMDYFVRKALHEAGYRSVPSPEVRPSLMILYRWGSHNNMGEQMSSDFPDFADADTLERARLVGGKKLVSEMARIMEWGETMLDRDER
jgi:hypothetical protein